MLRVAKDTVDPEYLCFLFNSPYVQNQIEQLKSAVATSQTELGVENLRRVKVIIPSLNEQRTIASELTQIRRRIPSQTNIEEVIDKAKTAFEQAIIAN